MATRNHPASGFHTDLELASDAWRIDHIRAHGEQFDLYPTDVVPSVELGQDRCET